MNDQLQQLKQHNNELELAKKLIEGESEKEITQLKEVLQESELERNEA